jgi:LemA protein
VLAIYIILGILLVIALWAAYTYNLLIHAENKVDEALSGIDVQLKQRHDLVPNLVETVRAYAGHEQRALAAATQVRAEAEAASAPRQMEFSENRLATQMRSVIALAEGYPDLHASKEFAKLMDEVTDVENEIQAARRLYNQNVEFFNSHAQSFPAFLIAAYMEHASHPFLTFEQVDADPSSLVSRGFAA